MVLRFGTSRSDTYGLSEKFETKLKTWINTPGQIVTDMIQWISDGISGKRCNGWISTDCFKCSNQRSERGSQ
jgi:hypothetical protein